MTSSAPFPHDLPDLLRLACGQGKMRLNVWFVKTERGHEHQSNFANSGNGWTVEYHRDPLEAVARTLRISFGAMLNRERDKLTLGDPDCKLKHHLPGGGEPFCDCGGTDHSDCFDGDDIADAIAFHFRRTGMDVSDAFISGFCEGVLDALYGKDAQPSLHEVTVAPAIDHDIESLIG